MDLSLIIHYILDREDVVNEAVGVTDVLWCVYMESLYSVIIFAFTLDFCLISLHNLHLLFIYSQ